MGDLSEERLTAESTFSYCGLDMFGPFLGKESRKIQTVWCTAHMFVSRAAHIETTNSRTTDSFIQALRTIIRRRRNIRIIQSDNGSN